MNLLNTIMSFSDAIVDGNKEGNYLDGLLISFLAIAIVFGVLLVIIFVTHFLFKGMNAIDKKLEKSESKFAKFLRRNKKTEEVKKEAAPVANKVEITDDDMMAAVLVATIDFQNEVKKDVKVVSVREVK